MQLERIRLDNIQIDNVIVARNPWQRLRGWFGYQNSEVKGVLLTACNAVHTFAMQIPLDLIWFDSNHRCIQVQLNVQPWRLKWCRGASQVLELRTSLLQSQLTQPNHLIGQALIRSTLRK